MLNQSSQTYFQPVFQLNFRTHKCIVSISLLPSGVSRRWVLVLDWLDFQVFLNCTGFTCFAVWYPLLCFPSGVRLRLLLLVNGWISKRQVCRSVSVHCLAASLWVIAPDIFYTVCGVEDMKYCKLIIVENNEGGQNRYIYACEVLKKWLYL